MLFTGTDLISAGHEAYGTLEQNKMGDVVTENTQKNKRTSPESFSSPYKAHRALYGDE